MIFDYFTQYILSEWITLGLRCGKDVIALSDLWLKSSSGSGHCFSPDVLPTSTITWFFYTCHSYLCLWYCLFFIAFEQDNEFHLLSVLFCLIHLALWRQWSYVENQCIWISLDFGINILGIFVFNSWNFFICFTYVSDLHRSVSNIQLCFTFFFFG